MINSVNNTKLPCYTLLPTQHHSFRIHFIFLAPHSQRSTRRADINFFFYFRWFIFDLRDELRKKGGTTRCIKKFKANLFCHNLTHAVIESFIYPLRHSVVYKLDVQSIFKSISQSLSHSVFSQMVDQSASQSVSQSAVSQ